MTEAPKSLPESIEDREDPPHKRWAIFACVAYAHPHQHKDPVAHDELFGFAHVCVPQDDEGCADD